MPSSTPFVPLCRGSRKGAYYKDRRAGALELANADPGVLTVNPVLLHKLASAFGAVVDKPAPAASPGSSPRRRRTPRCQDSQW